MKVLFALVTAALLAGSTAAQEVIRDGDKRYSVEVVSADELAKTLTIRTDKGQSTLLVDDRALTGLKTLRPGETITITLRDAATGQRQAVTAIVSGTVSGPTTVAGDRLVVRDYGTAVEYYRLDPKTKKITVIGDGGEKRVFDVDPKAMLLLANTREGQKVLMSYRFDADGRPEAVVRVNPPSKQPVVQLMRGTSVEVLSADPAARTLKIRNDRGDVQTLVVDDRTLVNLEDLKAGDTLIVDTEGDKVVVITRKR